MRWEQQTLAADDGALPGLQRAGFVRTVRTPEFAGTAFHEVLCKSALSHVPAASQVPFRWTINPVRGCGHQCRFCLHPSTLVLRADGRHVPLDEIKVGDEVIGTERQGAYRRYVRTTVEARWGTRKRAYRVALADGSELVASGDHRFLTDRGWKHVTGSLGSSDERPFLTTNNKLMGFGLGGPVDPPVTEDGDDYRRGYLAGMIRGDGMLLRRTYTRRNGNPNHVSMFRLALTDAEALLQTRAFLEGFGVTTHLRPFSPATDRHRAALGIFTSRRAHYDAIVELIAWPDNPSESWDAGFLAGIFDAEGSYSRAVLRIANTDETILDAVESCLARTGFGSVREGVGRKRAVTIRLAGGLSEHQRFFRVVRPAITRKLGIEGRAVKSSARLDVVAVEDLGEELDLIDITTGTGDFIANGVVSHNCFARGTHRYLDLNTGEDFDSQLVVKVNLVEVLRAELARKSWKGEHVALGTNTDPYQRAEGRYRFMPGVIDALASSGTPFSILTKGTLLRRDLPLLQDAADQVPVSVGVSLTTLDDELHHAVEPGAPSPRARLDLVRAVRDAGLPCHVMVAPVLPWLTDSTAHLDAILAEIADAGATRATVFALHLRSGAREWYLQWLGEYRPDLVAGYRRVYGDRAYASRAYQQWLEDRVRPLLRRHRLDGAGDLGQRWGIRASAAHDVAGADAARREPAAAQPALF